MKLSVQLHSLRYDIERDGMPAVLQAVKSAGFDGVEIAGTASPAQLRSELVKAGLIATGIHVSVSELDDTEKLKEKADALGCRDIIVCYLNEAEREKTDEVAAKIKHAKTQLKGYRLGYHNHDFEFDGGKDLTAEAEKAGAMLEPDIFWLKVAGINPLDFLKKRKKSVMAVHIKELSELGKDDFNPLPGEGIADTLESLSFAKRCGHEYAVLEYEKIGIPYDEYLISAYKKMSEKLEIE